MGQTFVCLLVLVLIGMASSAWNRRIVVSPQAARQAAYVECSCQNQAWNDAVTTWSYDPNHPNLSVEYH